jgi:hypothetical protein
MSRKVAILKRHIVQYFVSSTAVYKPIKYRDTGSNIHPESVDL